MAMNCDSDLCCSSTPPELPANADIWIYNPDELIRFPQRRKQNCTSTYTVWSHFKVHRLHASKEKKYAVFADKAWCDYCHKPFVREHSTLLRHLQRFHKQQLSNSCNQSDSSISKEKQQTTLKVKKAQLEQYFSSKVPPLTKAEHKNTIKLLALAWCDNLSPLLADSLSFNKFIACVSRGSFQMPGRTKMTEMVDELYAAMMVKLKALLQQSTSVFLTTDAAKMPTGDSCIAVTGHWISSDWELLSAVLGVSISNVSHTAQEIVSVLNEVGAKYTLDDRLDAIMVLTLWQLWKS